MRVALGASQGQARRLHNLVKGWMQSTRRHGLALGMARGKFSIPRAPGWGDQTA